MGLFDGWFSSGGGSGKSGGKSGKSSGGFGIWSGNSNTSGRFSTGGKSKSNGGNHHGVRQNGSGHKSGYVTYGKSTGRGKGSVSNREYYGPDRKR